MCLNPILSQVSTMQLLLTMQLSSICSPLQSMPFPLFPIHKSFNIFSNTIQPYQCAFSFDKVFVLSLISFDLCWSFSYCTFGSVQRSLLPISISNRLLLSIACLHLVFVHHHKDHLLCFLCNPQFLFVSSPLGLLLISFLGVTLPHFNACSHFHHQLCRFFSCWSQYFLQNGFH